MDWSDLIQVWIGIAVSTSAFFGWLSYRVAKGGFLLSLPHLVARSNVAENPGLVWLSLQGPGADLWDIQIVSVVRPTGVKLMEYTSKYDAYGAAASWEIGEPLGRSQFFQNNPIAISSVERPVRLRVKLSLKSSPNITSSRTAIIGRRN